MANRSTLFTAAVALTLLAAVPKAQGQIQSSGRTDAIDAASGIRTDRLTPKQLRIWGEIEKVVRASDKRARPLHPKLHSLWQRVQERGHTVFIEMMGHRAPTRIAGTTTLQQGNPDGDRKIIVIWLHLWAMDNAFVDPAVRRSDGLIPFYRLGKYERYAEVLGHELAHAFLMLENPEYARLSQEYGSAAAELLRLRVQGAKDGGELGQRLLRLQSLADKIEKPAQAAELQVWRELVGARKGGTLAHTGLEIGLTSMLKDLSRSN